MYDEDYPMDSGGSFHDEYANYWALDTMTMVILSIALTVFIIIGALGNGLVVWVVVRNRKMWTSRNLFIVNLAISDLLLCCFIIPSTFMEISTNSYIFGLIECKLTLALEYASMFVSTFSIVAIVLVSWNLNPSEMRQISTLIQIAIIWVGSTALAMPLFIYRTIESRKLDTSFGVIEVFFCYPMDWPINPVRGYFSYYWQFSMIVQYGLSIMAITIMFLWVKFRTIRSNSSTPNPTTIITWQKSKLPLSLFAIFCIGWLPLNLFNIATDWQLLNHFVSFREADVLCHMAGMASSCCNPFLYAWLDPSFRTEFKQIIYKLKRPSKSLCFRRSGSRNSLDNSPNHESVNLQEIKSESDA